MSESTQSSNMRILQNLYDSDFEDNPHILAALFASLMCCFATFHMGYAYWSLGILRIALVLFIASASGSLFVLVAASLAQHVRFLRTSRFSLEIPFLLSDSIGYIQPVIDV